MKKQIQSLIDYVNSNKNIVGEYKNNRRAAIFNNIQYNYEYDIISFYFDDKKIGIIHLDNGTSINKENNIVIIKTNCQDVTLTFFKTDIKLPDINFNTDIEDIFNDHKENKNEYHYILKREGDFVNICELVYDTINKDLMTLRLPNQSLVVISTNIRETNQGWRINKNTEILKIKK